ncbi:hypothetical protein HPB47_021334, partial [Ixodes persulcatus]
MPSALTLMTGARVRVVVLLLIATFSLVGNSATLTSIRQIGRAERSSLYLLLKYLHVADLPATAWCVLVEVVAEAVAEAMVEAVASRLGHREARPLTQRCAPALGLNQALPLTSLSWHET